MKFELEIPNLPEGVKPSGTLGVKSGELALIDGKACSSPCDDPSVVKLELLTGYEVASNGYPATIRRIPRNRVRIEFDMLDGTVDRIGNIEYFDSRMNRWRHPTSFTAVALPEGK